MPKEARPGRVIGRRYRLVEELASGGQGRVWRAHDTRRKQDVAVKELTLPMSAGLQVRSERVARAEKEARNAMRLTDHPNIVKVHDVVVDDGLPWIVMQLVRGESLAERLGRSGPLSEAMVTLVAKSVLSALRVAHDAGVVHRDVKPANVMLASDGNVLLTDFGIAKHLDDSTLTPTGNVIGTLAYTAPERLDGKGNDNPACDLFSLGVMLYESAEGRNPFRRDSIGEVYAAVKSFEPPEPERAGRLTRLITRLLDKNPRTRPGVRLALQLVDDPNAEPGPTKVGAGTATTPGTPPASEPPRSPRPPQKSSQGMPSWVKVGLAVVVAFVGSMVIWGSNAVGADVGDCVWAEGEDVDDWHSQPCGLSVPWATSYRVLDRSDGWQAGCPPNTRLVRVSSEDGDNKATLCLAVASAGGGPSPGPSSPEVDVNPEPSTSYSQAPPPEPEPTPEPTNPWANDPGYNASVGQCFTVSGTDSRPDLDADADCRQSYKVIARGDPGSTSCSGESDKSVTYNAPADFDDVKLCLQYKDVDQLAEASVGHCVRGSRRANDWQIVACAPNTFQVIAKHPGSDFDVCDRYDRYQFAKRRTPDGLGKNVVYCMTYRYTDDAHWAKKNTCVSHRTQGSSHYLYFVNCNQANGLVTGYTRGRYDPSFCSGSGWVAHREGNSDWSFLDHTVCFRNYP